MIAETIATPATAGVLSREMNRIVKNMGVVEAEYFFSVVQC